MIPKLDTKILENMKYSRIRIDSNIGEDILSSMRNAKKFIYIISPYISEEKINFLKGLNSNKKLDIKLLFADKSNFFKDEKEVSKLATFFRYSKEQDIDKVKIELENEKTNRLKKIKLYRLLSFIIFLGSSIGLYALYNLKKMTNINGGVLGVIAFLSFIQIFNFHRKTTSLDFELARKLRNFKENNIPNMELIDEVKMKFIRTNYCDKHIETPYPHLKIYLMDIPSISEKTGKIVVKAFVSSANFTTNGFGKNLEFFVETTDFEVTENLLNFFNEMYNNTSTSSAFKNTFVTHTTPFILEKLFKYGIIKHKD